MDLRLTNASRKNISVISLDAGDLVRCTSFLLSGRVFLSKKPSCKNDKMLLKQVKNLNWDHPMVTLRSR